jgi:hypothetical protein
MKSNLSLFKIAGEFLAMESQLRELDLDEDTIKDTLDAESGDLIDKLAAVVAVAVSMEAEAEAVRNYALASAQRRITTLEKRSARLKQYALDAMVATGQLSIDQIDLKFRVRENPESVVVDSDEAVPALFKSDRTTTVIDKAAIKEALKRGESVGGARLHRTKRLEVL